MSENLDVSLILEQTKTNFAQVKEAAGLDRDGSSDQDFFSIMSTRLQSMKASWDANHTSTTGLFSAASVDELVDFPSEFLDTWTWQFA